MPNRRTWLVMVRDVSHAVQIADEPTVVICMVLDVDTGLVLGVNAHTDRARACRGAFEMALTTPAAGAPFPPGPPDRVLCAADELAAVGNQLGALIGADAPPPEEVVPGNEAEDIFDSLAGHMAGRAQPVEPPSPDDWRHLIRRTHDYATAQPWTHPSTKSDDLTLEITIDGEHSRYVPVVLGQDEIQRGLVLYPGFELPDSVVSWQPGEPVAMPAGTLMCYLDQADETSREAFGKAIRYGWTPDADLLPTFVAITADGPADIGRRDARRFALAMAAVLRHVTDADETSETTGGVTFPNGRRGEYSITSRRTSAVEAAVHEAVRSSDPHELLKLLLGAAAGHDVAARARPARRRPRRDDVVTYRVRVDLKGAKPPCWRRLELASDLMLDELHEVLQPTFDWFGGHLHQFSAGGASFYHPDSEPYLTEYDIEEGEEGVAEYDVRLDEVLVDPGDRLFYLYDFGDGWEHIVKLEAVLPRDPDAPRAVCITGRRPSPPEDCGGIYGYEMVTAANDPTSPDHRQAIEALRDVYGPEFDPAELRPVPFDMKSINDALRDLFD